MTEVDWIILKTRCRWLNGSKGVCRDYAHLAVAFCRCMNIPARYCTGYLGEIGMLPPYGPMDFASWFEAYLGGGGYAFDSRNHIPSMGRVLIALGRDAADVPITHTFGPNTLVSFKVWTDEGPHRRPQPCTTSRDHPRRSSPCARVVLSH